MAVYILIAVWCIAQPVPFCMRMEMPNLTLEQCENTRTVAMKRAMEQGAFKGEGRCVREIGYPAYFL